MFLKDGDARLDYRVDWHDACAGGTTIAGSEWSVQPVHAGGIDVSDTAIGDAVTCAVLAGGRAGCMYVIGNRVTFSDGRIDERSLVVRVEER
jgi:hypothetical protein